MLPDSRSPRRLPIVIKTIAATPTSILIASTAGTAEMTCSTADAVDTATVIT